MEITTMNNYLDKVFDTPNKKASEGITVTATLMDENWNPVQE